MTLQEIITNREVKTMTGLYSHAQNSRVICGNYKLSIQASETHYCSPRETYKDMDSYTHVEMAIFGKEDQWLVCSKSSVMNAFPRANELRTYAEDWGGSCSVFGYVPVDLVLDLIEYLSVEETQEI